MKGQKSRDEIINEVKKIILDELKDVPVRVYLFGSWARGGEKRTSDIDIAIESKECLSSAVIIKLRSTFEESHIPYRVDIVNLDEADKKIYGKVIKEGLLWKG